MFDLRLANTHAHVRDAYNARVAAAAAAAEEERALAAKTVKARRHYEKIAKFRVVEVWQKLLDEKRVLRMRVAQFAKARCVRWGRCVG